MLKCLVTGGAGFIGSHLVDSLIEHGHEVVVIDNLSTGKKEYINSRAKFYNIDICARANLRQNIKKEQYNIVFHLAAQIDVRKSIEDLFFDHEVNVLGSLNLFEAAVKNGVKKIIFMSSGGALYGDVSEPATEDFTLDPTSPYAINKFTAESYLKLMNALYGTKYVIIRPSNVYGPRQFKGGEAGVIAIFTYNHVEGKISKLFGDGTKTRDYVYVLDLIDACIKAMDAGSSVYNIGTGRETSMNEMITIIEEATGREFYYEHHPDKPGEVWRSVLSYAKAEQEFGWKPTIDIKTGIKRTLDWLDGERI